jgi:hypothetical protein
MRRVAVHDVVSWAVIGQSEEAAKRLRAVAERAAAECRDQSVQSVRNSVQKAVDAECTEIRREERAARQAEAARYYEAQCAHREAEVRAEWEAVRRRAMDFAEDLLPHRATIAERERLAVDLRGLVDSRPSFLIPSGFRTYAGHETRHFVAAVEARVAVEEALADVRDVSEEEREGLRRAAERALRLAGRREQWELRNVVRRAINDARRANSTKL